MAAGTTITLDQIALKRSSTPGTVPTTLLRGEPFIQLADKFMLVGDGATEPVMLPRIPLKTEVELVAGAVFAAALQAATNSAVLTIRGGVATDGDTLAKVTARLDALGISGVSGLSAALAGKATPADISAAVSALAISSISGLSAALAGKATPTDISNAIANLTINSISGLSAALAAKATQTDITNAVGALTSGAPADLNTFAKVNDRFAALGISNIAGLAAALASKATPADINAAISSLTITSIAGLQVALDAKATLRPMTGYSWDTVDYNTLSTVLETRFINGGASANAPDNAAIHHYLGLGGGNNPSRGAQLIASASGGVSTLWLRVKTGTSWPAWVAVLTSANLGVMPVTPTGGTVATPVADLFARTLTVLDFGAVADAVEVEVVESGVVTGYTVTGTDNAAAFNAASDFARATGRAVIVPPGRYKASGAAVEWGDVNVYGAGAQIYVPNSAASSGTPPKYKIVLSTAPADIEVLDLAEIRQWTGWTRRSRRLQNMPTPRAGQFITVSTPWQYQLKRKSGNANSEVLFGEGFRVIDNTGRLAHTLFGNAKAADWQTGKRTGYNESPYYEARKCKSVVTVEGLKITTYRDGNFGTSASNACDAIVSVQRSFTTLRDVWLDNISGRQVLQGFNVDKCCDVRFYSCHVEGLQQVNTNYGWNIGTCGGVELFGCSQRFCRRGVDGHRSKHVKIIGGDYPDGIGAHYAWWMGAIGANIGPAGGSDNAQAFQIAGGGCYMRSCEVVCGPSTTAVARIRDDLFECGDVLAIEDCQIILLDGSGITNSAMCIVDATGPTGGFNYNVLDGSGAVIEARTVEMPRQISIRGNTIEDLDTTGRSVRPIQFLQDYSDAQFPSKIEVNTSWHVYGNAWKRTLPNSTLPDGSPWLQMYFYSPPAVIGRGVQAFVADMLTCYFWTYSRVNPATSDGRIDIEFARIPGRVDVRYGIGSYRRIRADVQDFRPSVISASSGFTPVGDEVIVSGGISGGGVSYPEQKVAASGDTVKYGATGVGPNINVLYRASGTATATLADVGQKAGFYGSAGALKQTIAAAATDAASTQQLANDLRSKLIALGLFS